MCAARVLSDVVDRVTIVERDTYPSSHEFRAGVPQARHVHNLLARGLREFDSFFPGFERRMRERGAVAVETGWDVATLWPHGWSRRSHTGLWQLYASRPLIEGTVLELCRDLKNVTFLERTEVTALRASGKAQRYCTGVEVLTRNDGKTRTLEADLVVDACGAQSKAAEWLRRLDLEPPEDEVIDAHSGYSSRWFTLGREHAWPPEWWWKVLFLRIATPEQPYFIAFFPIENQRWLLSYIGVNRAYPPTREDEFTAALERLVSPVVHEMVRRMEPISPVYPSRATRNRWRHYERWRTPLGRFVAIADAACSYNPRFGQGMSAATVSARLLKDCLDTYGIDDPRLPEQVLLRAGAIPEDAVAIRCSRRLATSRHRGQALRLGPAVQLVSAEAGCVSRPPSRRVPRGGDPSREADVGAVRAPGGLARPRVCDEAKDQGDGRKASSDGLRPMPPGGE